MSYCLNPDCQKPHNPSDAKFCLRCGTRLLLGVSEAAPQELRYRALELIGQSSYGRTFLAVDESKPSQPRCIIKQFFPQAQGTDDAEEAAYLFKQKAVRLEELGEHPQIPEVLTHLTQNHYQYLVQEFIEGQNLAQELESKGAFQEDQIRQILREILPVLQFVHESHLIHQNIKPHNIIRCTSPTPLLGEEGNGEEIEARQRQLILVDFGVAKLFTDKVLPPTGTAIGTAGYVAPEQALGKGIFASDLYSLGVTCIHLLTQTDPFELYSVSEGAWAWRDFLNTPVSQELGQIFDKMLETATKRRYQSAADVLDDLKLLDKASEPPTPLASVQPSLDETSESDPTSIPSVQPNPQPELQVPTTVKAVLTPQTQNWKCVLTLGRQPDGRANWFSGVTCIAFSPDGQYLVSGSEDSSIRIWEPSTGQEISTLPGDSNFVNSIAISPDGEVLASVGDDKIKLWELKTGQEIRSWTGHSSIIRSITFSPNGKILASGGNDTMIKLWNPYTGEEIRALSGGSLIRAVSVSPDGQLLASGDWDNKIKLWNLNTGEEIRTFTGHSHKVRTVSFSPDGQLLASGSSDKTIKIWQLETGELLHTLTGHTGWFAGVNSVAFSPDGQILASSSDDKTIKLWNPKTGEVITTLSGHSKGVSSVAFSPDGYSLASGSSDKTIKIWQPA
ncbi:MAG: WD40 repeat domain-containing serine/threonine-protein kinase [Cyanobacteriota bacterium]